MAGFCLETAAFVSGKALAAGSLCELPAAGTSQLAAHRMNTADW